MRFSVDLDAALRRRGFDITVFTSDQIDERTRSPHDEEDLHGIAVRRFPNPWNRLASTAPWVGLYPLGLRQALWTAVRRFDVVHVTESRGAHARWAFAAAREHRIPVVWSPLGSLADGVGIRRPYRHGYDAVHNTRQLVGEACALIAQSSHEAAVFERLDARPEQVRVIEIGVDARWFRDLPARGSFRHALGIEEDQPLVLFTGRLHPTKGLDILLKAVAIVRRRHPKVQVVLIGWDHGALRTVRRVSRASELQDAVRVLPPAFELTRIQAYVDADVFAVAATTYEETSLAALEAVACGTPCVLTRQCEVPGLEAAGGGLVTDCTPGAFAEGLLAVLDDAARRARAERARRMVLAWRTTEHSADAHADLFNEVTCLRPAVRRPLARIS